MIIRVDWPLSPVFLTDSQSKSNNKKSIKMDTTMRDGRQKQDNGKHRKLNLKTVQVDKIRQKGIYAEGKYVNTHNSF